MDEPVWVMERLAVAAHFRQLAEHGGQEAGFDRRRLAQALAWPQELFLRLPGVRYEDLATAYAEAVLKAKPFVEGNIRTAFLLMMLFCRLNNRHVPAAAQEKLSMFCAMKDGAISRASMAEWMALRQLAFKNNAETIVRLKIKDQKVVGLTILSDKKTTAEGLNDMSRAIGQKNKIL